MKAIVINGSPRKGWNTHQMLKKVEEGLEAEGAEVEFVDLYDLQFSGCRSCFACKRKGSACHGVCAWPDDLKPVMESIMASDVVVMGTPIYLGNMSAQMNLLWERLMFCCLTYSSYTQPAYPRGKRCAMVVSMGADEMQMRQIGYDRRFSYYGQQLGYTLGDAPARMLWCCDAYQFDDYSKYEISPDRADPVKKQRHREQVFPQELERAYELGRELARG